MRAALTNKHKIKLFVYLSVLTVSFVSSFIVLITVIRPIFVQRLQYYTHIAATEAINDAIADVFSKESDTQQFVSVDKNSDGIVTALFSNTVQMNKLRAKVASALEKNLKTTDIQYINIPIGSILGNEILAGIGPDVKIKIRPVGIADIDFCDDFESCGINQSRHTVYIVVSIDIAVIAPQLKTSNRVSAKIPVAQTVIVGNVPQYFGTELNPVLK